MKRSMLAALLMVGLTSPTVYGQAKLLPPITVSDVELVKSEQQVLEFPLKAPTPTLGPPTSLPPVVPTPTLVPQTAPPHQMQGREPAHGTATAGVPKPPLLQGPALDKLPALPVAEVVGPPGRFWAELDTLVWFVSGDKTPGLVTTSPPGTPQNLAGVLGAGNTSVLGGSQFNESTRVGMRLNVGYWLDPLQTFGIQAGGFWLGNNNSQDTFSSSSTPILARPFVDVTTGNQSAELVAYPGVSSGAVVVSSHSSLDGWDVDLRENACCLGNGRIDAVIGYRQLRLAEQLGIGEDVTVLGAGALRGLPVGTNLIAVDRFDTANDFYGCEFGFVGEYRCNGWVLEGVVKMAAGWNVTYYNINGATFLTPPGGPTTTSTGGTLAQTTNIGQYRRSDPTLIPELGLNAAYDLTDHLRLRGGYSFLYWDQVARPGNQIDTGVNPSFLPPGTGGSPARPQPTLTGTDLFVHGMNFGVEVRY